MTQTPNVVTETPSSALNVTSSTLAVTEALRMLRLRGAVYLRGEFAEPFGWESLGPEGMRAALCPDARQLVIFHAVIEGECEVLLPDGDMVFAEAGDAVVLPYGDQHSIVSPGVRETVGVEDLLPPPPWGNMLVMQDDNPRGRRTRVLCSYLDCGDVLFNPLLQALPKLMVVRPRPGPGADWLRAGLQYASQLSPDGMAHDPIGSRLPELLLVETLRQYLTQTDRDTSGWLAALADPLIGGALLRIHSDPARAWSVPLLAEELSVSRSVLGARFVERLGVSPMRYVGQWRRQVASHLLRTTELPIAEIAARVGYESEQAFSRAFKRDSGVSPGAWRNGLR